MSNELENALYKCETLKEAIAAIKQMNFTDSSDELHSLQITTASIISLFELLEEHAGIVSNAIEAALKTQRHQSETLNPNP
jgi:hypothetical protein